MIKDIKALKRRNDRARSRIKTHQWLVARKAAYLAEGKPWPWKFWYTR